MKEYYRMINDTFHYKKIGILIFIIFCVQRFFYVAKGLPYYSLDENEIVEYSIGYLGGDLNPYWFKYGPLFSYLLAFIFLILSFFFEGPVNNFAEYYFGNPTIFYLSARIFSQFIHVGIAIIGYKITKDFISKSAAPLSLTLGLIPFIDSMTDFYTRVDSLLAFTFIVAIYFALHFFKSNHWKWYVFTGIFIGASIATKPLPALLIMPPIYFIWVLSQLRKSNKKWALIPKFILSSIINIRLHLLLFSTLISLFILHPYAFIEFKAFYDEQLNTFISDSDAPWSKGYEIGSYLKFGLPFFIIMVISYISSFFYFKKKNFWIILSLLFFVTFYWGIFFNKPIREYFYLPLFGIFFIITSYQIHLLYSKIKLKSVFSFLLFSIFILFIAYEPIKILINDYAKFGLNYEKVLDSGQNQAEIWIENNITVNSKILYYGYYTSLPRLIDPNPQEQAKYGDYFMYQRWNNKYLVDRFSNFMVNYSKNGFPTYDLIYQLNVSKNSGNQSYYTRYEMGEDEQYLLSSAKKAGAEYIVTNYNLEKYPEFQNLRVWSSMGKSSFGGDINIYKIQ